MSSICSIAPARTSVCSRTYQLDPSSPRLAAIYQRDIELHAHWDRELHGRRRPESQEGLHLKAYSRNNNDRTRYRTLRPRYERALYNTRRDALSVPDKHVRDSNVNNIASYTETLTRYSYIASWDSLNSYVGDQTPDLAFQKAVPMLQASVSKLRVGLWTLGQLLVTVTAILTMIQVHPRYNVKTIVGYAAVPMIMRVEVDGKDPTDSLRNTTFVRKEHANLKFEISRSGGGIPLEGLRTREIVYRIYSNSYGEIEVHYWSGK